MPEPSAAGGTPSSTLTTNPAKTAGPAVPRQRPGMSLLLRCSPGRASVDTIFCSPGSSRPHPAGVRPEHPRILAARGRIRHGDRAGVGDGAPARRGPVRPLPAQRGRERRARRPHPRVRHLRRVPHAHGTPPCRPVGQRGPGPARATGAASGATASWTSPLWPAPCWRSSTRSTSTRPCWSGTRWAARSASRWRTRRPSGSTASSWSPRRGRAEPAAAPRARPAGAGRGAGEPEDGPGRAAGLPEVRTGQRPAPVPRADPLPVAGAVAAHPRPDAGRPGWPRPAHAVPVPRPRGGPARSRAPDGRARRPGGARGELQPPRELARAIESWLDGALLADGARLPAGVRIVHTPRGPG